jgi:hypothetical protein
VAQVDPVWDGNRPSSTQFTLHFVTKVTGIGMTTYFIRPTRLAILSSVLEYSSSSSASSGDIVGDWHYESKPLDGTNTITVENSVYLILRAVLLFIFWPTFCYAFLSYGYLIQHRYRVTLSGYGKIKAITRMHLSGENGSANEKHTSASVDGHTVQIDQEFLTYNSRGGAYLT